MIVYDIELGINFFLIVFLKDNKFFKFEISPRKNQSKELFEFLKKNHSTPMVGFRNILFDYPILHLFIFNYKLPPQNLVKLLYNKSVKIIREKNEWKNVVKNPLIPQIDLFLINHFNNKSKMTSLKVLEFNMRMNNIKEMNIDWRKPIPQNRFDEIVNYCINDVIATNKFLKFNEKAINFRKRMTDEHNFNFINSNDVKIGEIILLKEIAKYSNIDESVISSMRTLRDIISVNEIILPHISFKTEPLQVLLKWWKRKNITKTKGEFTRIPFDEVQELLPYCNPKKEKGALKNLNIILNEFQFDFGTGGLHGALKSGIWRSNDEYHIILYDVSSYYPNLAFVNKFHPEHIPVDIFMNVIKSLYDQKVNGKKIGDIEAVKSTKLALNGALYGKSNSNYSFMYDPKFMMSICINGQLLLISELIEEFMINNFEVIQVNTDGVLVYVKKSKKHIADNIINNWMNKNKLLLEEEYFELFVQKDVNNYLGLKSSGKLKLKGVFDYKYAENDEWHKNFSALVVPKALEAYFVNNIQPEDFLKNHNDLYDFFLRTKFNKNTRLVTNSGEVLQNVTRYYIGMSGNEFIKIMPPLPGKEEKGERHFAVEKGYLCVEMNEITEEKMNFMKTNINYEYYINKINDVIEIIT